MKAASTPSGGKLERIFVGRKTERETFKAVLNSIFRESGPQSVAVANWMDEEDTGDAANDELPHIFLISGHGGIGKSRLLERLHSLAYPLGGGRPIHHHRPRERRPAGSLRQLAAPVSQGRAGRVQRLRGGA